MNLSDTRVLIVDDDSFMRCILSSILSENGYLTRVAHDGFSALTELRNWNPSILISDLNMPGMSGYEFLSIVRRRFPSIFAIAMSGAYQGGEVPPEVVADAFYAKGGPCITGLTNLLGQIRGVSPVRHHSCSPIWISVRTRELLREAVIAVACPECLRTFSITLRSAGLRSAETACEHCHTNVRYEIHPSLLLDNKADILLSLVRA